MKNDEFLCERNDAIYDAVFETIKAMAVDEVEWDMNLIGPLVEEIELYLKGEKIETCYPWEDLDGNICYSTEERCYYCRKKPYLI